MMHLDFPLFFEMGIKMLSMEDNLLLRDFSFCLFVCLLLFYKFSNLMIASYLKPFVGDAEEILQYSSGHKTNTTEAKISCESRTQLVGQFVWKGEFKLMMPEHSLSFLGWESVWLLPRGSTPHAFSCLGSCSERLRLKALWHASHQCPHESTSKLINPSLTCTHQKETQIQCLKKTQCKCKING